MPIQVSWDSADQSIILSQSSGTWTWDEYHLTLSQIADMIKTVNHRVDLITVRLPGSVHPSGSGIPHYQRAMRMLPDNTGMNVIINTSGFARSIVSIFLRLYSSQANGVVVLAGSVEEARALIAKDRTKSHSAELS